MSGTLFKFGKPYEFGYALRNQLYREMLDGIPICSREDMGMLVQMIYNSVGDHLEIGSAYGGTMLAALRAMDLREREGKVVCIEPFGEDTRDTLHKAVEREFWRNVEHFGVKDRIEHIKAFSHPFPVEPGRRFGTCLIDGDHHSEYVKNDWFNVKDVVNQYVMFHDYTRDSVRNIVNQYAAQDPEWVLVAVHGWSAVMLRKSVP